ncbi:MAG: 4Fe-4S dicluster domain-containing protein [Acidimicrobiales bacterium]
MISQAWVAVDDTCRGCGACIATCPEHSVIPTASHRLARLAGWASLATASGGASFYGAAPSALAILPTCSGCLACIEVCPAGSISEVPGPRCHDRPSRGPRAPGRAAATARLSLS